MKKKLSTDTGATILDIGTCGLHTVHNCFKTGADASGWKIDSLLLSLFYLFKDSPARREDLESVLSSRYMPLKFVNHRWLENVPVVERALLIWEDVRTYVDLIDQKKFPKPGNGSYSVVSEALKDPFIKAKMHFFKSVALHLQPFLASYQTDAPMISFLADDLLDMLKGLMRRFIKPSVLASTSDDMIADLTVTDKEIQVSHKHVDIGFLAERELEKLKSSELQVMKFRVQCRDFLLALVKKLLLKSPLTHSIVWSMTCLSPPKMATNPDECRRHFRIMLSVLVDANRISDNDAEELMHQFTSFMDRIPANGSQQFSGFNKTKDRLDEFFHQQYKKDLMPEKLFRVVQKLLVLSHGQASVERGFSINKEVEVENLSDKSLIARRLICDYVKSVGGVLEVPLTKELLLSAVSSRSRYEQYLEDERQRTKTVTQQKKRKHILDEIDDLKQKKKRMKMDIDALFKSADSLADKAEHTGNTSLIRHSNCDRRKAKDKRKELEKIEGRLNEKVQSLKE